MAGGQFFFGLIGGQGDDGRLGLIHDGRLVSCSPILAIPMRSTCHTLPQLAHVSHHLPPLCKERVRHGSHGSSFLLRGLISVLTHSHTPKSSPHMPHPNLCPYVTRAVI